MCETRKTRLPPSATVNIALNAMNSICHKTAAHKWLSFGYRDISRIRRAGDKIRFPVITTTAAIMAMMMNTRLLLFLFSLANEFPFFPRSFQECFSCVSSYCILFWHFCQGAMWRGARGQRVQQLTLDAGWPAGCRLPRSCRHHFVPPWATPKATTDQLAECFTAAALDRPSEKLMAVNSSRLRHIGLSPGPMSFLAPLLITPVSFLHISQGKTWRERDREKGRDGEEGVETQQSGVLSSLVPGD